MYLNKKQATLAGFEAMKVECKDPDQAEPFFQGLRFFEVPLRISTKLVLGGTLNWYVL